MNKFIADTHFGHANILLLRPCFNSVEEMDETIIKQWNEHVDSADDVWIVGDFIYRASVDASYYLKRLRGHKHLIIGNHDVHWIKIVQFINTLIVSII